MQRKKKRIRQAGILQVAAKAGVSPATVSRYFNHPEIVRYETRNRIQAAAVELGYVRNRVAGGLNRGRSGTIGLIVPTVDNTIFSELIEEFASSLDRFEHALIVASHGYDLVREASQVQMLLEHQIDGLVMVGGRHAAETFHLIEANDLPALTVWNWQKDPPIPCIGVDNKEVGRIAARHLLELGHRDVACLFPTSVDNDRVDDRRRSALATFARAGAPVPPARQIACPYDIDEAKQIAGRLLAQADRPTAILGGNDIIGQAAIFAACATGLDVPGDVSVIGIGNFRGSAALEPSLTTVGIPAKEIAVRSARIIVDMVGEKMLVSASSERLGAELVWRSSTAAPKG